MDKQYRIQIGIGALDKASGKLKQVSSSVAEMRQEILKAGAKISAAGALISGTLYKMASGYAAWGDHWKKFERQTGVSVEALQGLSHAVQIWGGNEKALEAGVRRLSKAMYDSSEGLATYKRIFDELGISVERSPGKLKSIQSVIMEIADAFSRMEDRTKKAAIAQELFGRSGLMMVPLLSQGRGEIEALISEAKDLGIVLSEEDAAAAEAFTDANLRLHEALSGLRNAIAREIVPELTVYQGILKDVLIDLRRFTEAHGELTKLTFKLGIGFSTLGTSLIGTAGTVWAFEKLWGTLVKIRRLMVRLAAWRGAPFVYGILAGAIAAKILISRLKTLDFYLRSMRSRMRELSRERDWEKPAASATEQTLKILRGELERIKKLTSGLEEIRVGFKMFKSREEAITWIEDQIKEIESAAKRGEPIELPAEVSFPALIESAQSAAELLRDHPIEVPVLPEVPGEGWLRAEEMDVPELLLDNEDVEKARRRAEELAFYVEQPFEHLIEEFMSFKVNAKQLWDSFWHDILASFKRYIAQLIAQRLAMSFAESILGPIGIVPVMAAQAVSAPKGKRVFQRGGTLESSLPGVDRIPAILAGGETVISRDLTNRLERFLESAEGGAGRAAAGQLHVNVNAGVMLGGEAEALEMAEIVNGKIDTFERLYEAQAGY